MDYLTEHLDGFASGDPGTGLLSDHFNQTQQYSTKHLNTTILNKTFKHNNTQPNISTKHNNAQPNISTINNTQPITLSSRPFGKQVTTETFYVKS